MDFQTGNSGQQAAQLVAVAYGAPGHLVEFGLQKQYKYWANDFPGLDAASVLSMLQNLPQITTDLVGLELVGLIDMNSLELVLQGSGFSLHPDAGELFYYTNGVLSVTVVDAVDAQGSVTGQQDLQIFHEPFLSPCANQTEVNDMCQLLATIVPFYS